MRGIAIVLAWALTLACACNGTTSLPPGAGNGGGNGDTGEKPGVPGGPPRPDIGARPKWPPEPVAYYPAGQRHSPLSPAVVRHLRIIAAAGPSNRRDVFAKIGDSHSVGVMFLECFGPFVEEGWSLGDHEHLRPTLDFFIRGNAAGTSPFERESVATRSGMSARGVINGDPSLLEMEIDALTPRFAIVMFGTNDSGGRSLSDFAEDMLRIVDTLAGWGVVPLMSTIPPHGEPERRVTVRRFNGVIRAIAAVRNLPLVDLHDALLDLPGMGLRDDDVHLSVDWNSGGGQAACRMVDGGLQFGANVRNLLTLEQLDRVHTALSTGEALDPDPAPVSGSGRRDDPIRIPGLPFSDGRVLSSSDLEHASDLPEPCEDGAASEGVVYAVDVERDTDLFAMLHTRFGAQGVVEIVADDGRCLSHAPEEASAWVTPGRYRVVVRVGSGEAGDERAEYVLSVVD